VQHPPVSFVSLAKLSNTYTQFKWGIAFFIFLLVSPLGALTPPSEEETSHYPLIEIEIEKGTLILSAMEGLRWLYSYFFTYVADLIKNFLLIRKWIFALTKLAR